MKIKKLIIFLFIGIIVLFYSSCEDDYETVPLEQFTIDFVFSTTDSLGKQAYKYLTSVYSRLPNGHNRVGGDYLDAASDDAISSAITENAVAKLATGQYTSASTIYSDMAWGDYYHGIRIASTFISNIDVVPLMETFNDGLPLNSAWKSEARFIRAFLYFELIKRYGGVPIMGDEVRQLGDDLELPRNTFEECVNYIVNELDEIRDSLRIAPITDLSAYGHVVTRESAMALKSRVLLYAASPLFNGGNIDASNPLTGYVDEDAQRWKAAADAAKYFIDNYTYFELLPNFNDVFTTPANKEVIFYRQSGENTSIEYTNGPVGFSGNAMGNGRTSPSQNLVDAFPMLNGKSIDDETSGYNMLNMYDNRDPRMNKTVIHNGSDWLSTTIETFDGGVNNPNIANQKTKSSYYMRKFMGNFEGSKEYSNTLHEWILFRYAEILLNYAEAQNEYAGPTDEVYQVIFDLRNRAGIEAGDDEMYGLKAGMSKAEMRKIIQNERRIEMAFEEQRYWDVRRWKIAEDVMNESIKGLQIIKSASDLNMREIEILQPSFATRQYFYPIPYNEVIKNDNMVQNPGW
nr:RagB/SusD family nutrient uptake outer membrane protein [uncultured Carboxylicivirga sp.]